MSGMGEIYKCTDNRFSDTDFSDLESILADLTHIATIIPFYSIIVSPLARTMEIQEENTSKGTFGIGQLLCSTSSRMFKKMSLIFCILVIFEYFFKSFRL